MKSYLNRNVISLAIPVTIGTGNDKALAQGALNALHCRLVHDCRSSQPVVRIYVDSSWARLSEMQEWIREPFDTVMMTHFVFEGDVDSQTFDTVMSTTSDIVHTWGVHEKFPPYKPSGVDFENHFDVDEMLDLILD